MKNIDFKSSQIGQKVAQDVIRAIKDHKKGKREGEIYSHLRDFIIHNPHSKEFLENISNSDNYTICKNNFKEQSVERLVNEIKNLNTKKKRFHRLVIYSLSVASALIAISMLVYYATIPQKNILAEYANHTSKEVILCPTLITADGNKIELGEITNNKSTYRVKDKKTAQTDSIKYQTIVVPSNYSLKVILVDSSEVILNANSKLHYPESFSGEKREVILEGEGYFKVRKSNKPFRVIAENSVVKVYGTDFNINAYHKNRIRTTLVNGQVGVSVKDNVNLPETMLTPNHMLEMDGKGKSTVAKVDPTQHTSWMLGDISVVDESLTELMDKIAHWYGVEFIIDEGVKEIKMSTTFSNTMKLEKVLQSIMITTDVHIVEQKNGKYVIL